MKFKSLRVYNWRSFHGLQKIDFSIDDKKPVTLILGPNGAGKTALLNAFTWVLYGHFTDGFQRPDSLINFEALKADPSAESWVELILVHDNSEFCIRRVTDQRRQSSGETVLTVTKDGQRTVEDDIYRILPKPLKDLFFFPAETFSTANVLEGDSPGDGASFDVGTAIRSLLSGDVYDHAVEDLRQAIESEALKPPKNYTDDTVEAARKCWEQAQAELNAAEQRRDNLPALLAQARDQAAKAKKEAEKYNPVEIKKWEAEYRRLKDRVNQAEQLVEQANNRYVDLAGAAYLHFAHSAVQSAVSRLDMAEKAGLMPPRIHESVLHKALEDDRCPLCQVDLKMETRTRIQQLLEHVTEANVAALGLEARSILKAYINRAERQIGHMGGHISALAESLKVAGPKPNADIKMLQSVLRMCIDGADRQLTKAAREFKEFQEAQEVTIPPAGHSPLDVLLIRQRAVDHLEEETKHIDAKVNTLEVNVRAKLADYTKKSSKSDGYKRKTAAIEILREVKEFFDEARKGLNQHGRIDFERAVNATYSDLIKKPYNIRVSDDFSIRVSASNVDQNMPLSQSEKVLLLIAFLGAIARLAPHYEEIARFNEQFYRTGSIDTSQKVGFPVVLDSPTSPLDTEYEVDVIKALPHLLPQIVVITSAKSVDAWENIGSHIGSAYIMELTSHKTNERVVRWNGKDYQYGIHDAGVDPARTRISDIN
ncbi:AAA family ATPase [Nonomuraea sp. NPDC051191]|uniref:AAA family ATPase n=1 Tax=Nonomuraea sp. NPDC051191 TaxID=3364372 RepID=UPI0037A0003C